MRILRVAQKVYPDVPGGGAYHVHAMSRDQAAMGHDVTVLTVQQDEDAPRREERDGYTLFRFDPTTNLLGNEISMGLARELWGAEGFDVIHAHSHLYFSTNVAALRRRFDGTPLAITNHGLYSQSAPRWLFDWYLKTIGRWTFDRADVVFCYTPEDRDRVRSFGIEAQIEVVPNGVDTDRFTPCGPTSTMIEHDGPVVLFVGRLVDGKRPGDAVQAVTRLPPETDAKLYVVGEGPKRSEIVDMADDTVEFLGHVAYDEMPAIYRSGDALILPSRAEGLPRTVLEAFASGLPVVASDLKQVAPIVETDGRTVTIGDVEGYVEAIEQVLDDAFLGQEGRQLVVDQFRWRETVRETTDVLESLVSA